MRAEKSFVNGRIVGGYSLHDVHDPSKCDFDSARYFRCVDCCGVEPDRDIMECSKCGKQQSVSCTFDDDFA